MHHQGIPLHQAGVVVHVGLAEMQHQGMHPPGMDPPGMDPPGMAPLAGLGRLPGVMHQLTETHLPEGMALLHPSEGRGRHPRQLGVGLDGRCVTTEVLPIFLSWKCTI